MQALDSGQTIAFSTTDDANVSDRRDFRENTDDQEYRQVPMYTKMGFLHLGQKIVSSPWGEWPVHIFGLSAASGEGN